MTESLRPIILLSLVLFGCQQGDATENGSEISDAQAVAAVEAAQNRKPPVQLVALQPIPRGDIDRYNLHDSGCAFSRPSDNGDPLILVGDGRAMVRVEGEVHRLAADVGGEHLGTRAWQYYSGKKFALSIKPTSGAKLPADGTAELRDAYGRVIFATTGRITCAA